MVLNHNNDAIDHKMNSVLISSLRIRNRQCARVAETSCDPLSSDFSRSRQTQDARVVKMAFVLDLVQQAL